MEFKAETEVMTEMIKLFSIKDTFILDIILFKELSKEFGGSISHKQK